MLKRIFILRRLLLCAGFFAPLLLFWLSAHEVFDGPKTYATLVYGCLLFATSLPLLADELPRSPRTLRPWLAASGLLLGASLLSFLGAWASLPGNLALNLEKLAPMLACCLAALVFVLESPDSRSRVLFSLLASHGLMVFYGLIQVLDQTLGQPLHLSLDLIHWTSFGESRVYSTLGNPDYMAAQISLFLPLWLGLGYRRPELKIRTALATAALALLLLPLLTVFLLYGFNGNVLGQVLQSYPLWAGISLGLFWLCRSFSARQVWLGFAYLLVFLIVVAQGRGAYLGLAFSGAVMLALAAKAGGRGFFRMHADFFRRNLLGLGILLLGLGSSMVLRSSAPDAALLKVPALNSALRVSDSLFSRVTHMLDKGSDASFVRRFYYQAALRLGLQHPIFGIGFGNHALFTARAQSDVWKAYEKEGNPAVTLVEPHVELYTHNDFLQNFAETGLIGLAAFLFFWFFFIRQNWLLAMQGGGQGPKARFGLGMLGLAAAFSASAMFNFPWRVLPTQQLCWFAFALSAVESGACGLPRPETAEGQQRPRFGLYALGLAIAFFLALWPVRWYAASCLFKQGNLGRDQANYAYGEAFYSKAVEAGLSGTQRVELYLYLGSMENALNKPDKAEEWFNKGIEIYPDFIEAHYNLGYTYLARYQSSHLPADLQEAEAEFLKVLDINPRYANALNNLGNIYYAQHDFKSSAAIYEKLIRFSPSLVEARYNLGAAYLMLQQKDKAIGQLQEALKIQPGYPQATALLAQVARMPKGASFK